MIKLDIKDELEGAKKYRKLEKKLPKEKIAIDSMAVDEMKHAKMLKKIKSECKGRALNQMKY
jgi:rubrerythrin